jgi:hypothetical protein
LAAAVLLAVLPGVIPRASAAQADAALPFAVGERLNYKVHIGSGAAIGQGCMWIEGPVDIRGTATILLRSDFHAHIGWFGASDQSDSWIDPARMAVVRFDKAEKQFLHKDAERVEIYPAEQRWMSDSGQHGASPTNAPLDELSFIYYVRTLLLAPDSAYSITRHYDTARNPVAIKVLGRQTIKVEAGEFHTVVVEMRVKDARHYKSVGVIKLFLTDDRTHIPVRIESAAPIFGTAVFTLESYTLGSSR